jgi:hypothetical protein
MPSRLHDQTQRMFAYKSDYRPVEPPESGAYKELNHGLTSMLHLMKRTLCLALVTLLVQTAYAQSSSDTLRLFLIGNSFSQNATRYLPQMATEGGHPLVIQRAELGGCSLQRHWDHAAAYEADSLAPKGKPYKGKSLKELLSEGKWDIVTLQQYSMLSADPTTYEPYASKLHAYIKALQPQAKIVFHQTWAYRSDADGFGQTAPKTFAASEREMWEKSRAAYHTIAKKLNVPVIPVGDAFWKNSTDPRWGYQPDPKFDARAPQYPALPNQTHSLHVGYRWTNDKKLGFDSHHANEAGCYLGGLVWYGFLFGESPQKVSFAPKEVPSDFAAHLKQVANTTLKKTRTP